MEKTPKLILSIAIVMVAVLGLIVYGYLQFRDYLQGPVIAIAEPENGALLASPLITVAGKTENAAFLTLNGKQIFTDETGNFREQLLLQEGYTILAIDAKDRFGHVETKQLELVYNPEHDTNATNRQNELHE